MKKLFTFLLILTGLGLAAQPANDTCSNAIEMIDYNTATDLVASGVFNNINASESVISPFPFLQTPAAWNDSDNDVWFRFTTNPAVAADIRLTVTGVDTMADGSPCTPLASPQIAVYRYIPGLDPCGLNNLAELNAAQASLGAGTLSLDILGVDPNTEYYVRINGYSNTATPDEGCFVFTVEPVPVEQTCNGTTTITGCSGTLVDSGGSMGDYGPNESCTQIVQPGGLNQCIIIDVISYDTEGGFAGDDLVIYDGVGTSGPILGTYNGLGGGFQLQTASGAFTVDFQSDGSVQGAGFEISYSCSLSPCTFPNPADITCEDNPQVLVDELVSSPQIIISNVVLDCASCASGTFTAQNPEFGIESGIILTTGQADNAEGPNNSGSQGTSNPGFDVDDPELSYLAGLNGSSTNTNDICILEFDVYAGTDELSFDYVFGSEEYEEFVGSSFNDVFGFFISGPGVTPDPGLGVYKNIAVLEQTSPPIPVSINSVNQNSSANPVTGQTVYFNNSGGVSTEYDGFTAVLTAKTNVIPCNTYHLKLAIADTGDNAYDSGVFLANLKLGTPEIFTSFQFPDVGYSIEGCTDDQIDITLTNPTPVDISYDISYSGTATNGVDNALIPDSIVYPPGTSTVTIPITAIDDGIPEGQEFYSLVVSKDFGCGPIVYDSLTVFIEDNVALQLQDTFFFCEGSSGELFASGANNYIWAPADSLTDINTQTPGISPQGPGTYFVTGFVGATCFDVDSTVVVIRDPQIEIPLVSPVNICEGESLVLPTINNSNDAGITWITGAATLDDPNSANPTATPTTNTTYIVELNNGTNCSVFDTLVVTVSPLDVPTLVSAPTICQGQSLQLAADIPGTTTTYTWTASDGSEATTLSCTTCPDPIATPTDTTTYTVTSVSANGACSDVSTVTVNVFDASVTIQGPDTIFQCAEDGLQPITFTAVTNTGTSNGLTWAASDGSVSASNTFDITVNPTSTTTYITTFNEGFCTVNDQVTVKIDSLPEFGLTATVPAQGIFAADVDTVEVCSDDFFFIQAPAYDENLYPNAINQWSANGVQLPVGNATVSLGSNNIPLDQSVVTLVRSVTIGSCFAADTIVIVQTLPQDVTITPSDTTICTGEIVAIVVSGGGLAFTPDASLNILTDSAAIAQPTVTTTYTATGVIDGCQVSISSTVNVDQLPTFALNDGQTVCEGTTVTLGDATNNPNFTYSFVAADGSAVVDADTGNPSATPLVTTSYFVTVSSGACSVLDTVTVNVTPAPSVTTSGDVTVCTGSATDISVTAPAGATLTWVASDGSTFADPSLATQTVSPTTTTSYTVTADVGGGCPPVSETLTVTVTEQADLSVSNDTIICFGEAAQLTATASAGQLTWTTASGDFISNDATVSVSPAVTTTYNVELVPTGACPTVTAAVTVTVTPAALVDILPDVEICEGDAIDVTAVTVGGDIVWTADDGSTFADPTAATQTLSPATTTTYTVTVQAPNGCPSTSTSFTVTVVPSFFVDVLPIDPTILQGESVDLDATVTFNGPVFPVTYSWSPVDGLSDATIEDPTASPLVTTTYTLTVTTAQGCEELGTVTVFVDPVTEAAVPNVFSPNGDDLNDDFLPIVGSTTVIREFKVFDRWGNMVHSTSAGEAWDGTYNGDNSPSDVYMYLAEILYPDGQVQMLSGDVTLVR